MPANFFGDLRLGLRAMAKHPGFAALAVLTLALGIGANSAIFSVLHATLLKPLPYPDADRLVVVWNKYPKMELPKAPVSIPDYVDRRDQVRAFEDSALYAFGRYDLATEGLPEHLIGLRATASLFRVLQVEARQGRLFDEEDDQPGREAVVVLSHDLWKNRFGADPAIVGRDVRLDGQPHRVLGVLPEGFAFPDRRVDLWKPFAIRPEQHLPQERGREFARMVARLAPGASVEQAQLEIDAIHEANKDRFPRARQAWNSSGFGGLVVDYREELYGELRPQLLLLQAAAAFVLLIACANVANLLLARLNGRRRELALRAALGAGPWRVAGQLFAEGLVLAGAGSAVGVWIGVLGLGILRRSGVDATGGEIDAGLDPAVLFFALGLALATGVVFSLLPVLSSRRSDPNGELKDSGGRGASWGGGWQRHALVVGEMALALVLLMGAGLMIRTMIALRGEDPGFARDGLLVAKVSLPAARYGVDGDRIVQFFEQVLERLRGQPGIEAATAASSVPFDRNGPDMRSYLIEGYEPPEDESEPHASVTFVEERYFETLGIPILAGRSLERFDTAGGEFVAVVDRRLVEKYFPDGDPLDARLSFGRSLRATYRIVGVAGPVKIQDLDKPVSKESIYVNFRQFPPLQMAILVRSRLEGRTLERRIRETLRDVDSEVAPFGIATLDTLVAESLRERRVSMVLLAGFGAVAVLLAAVGIYGVLSFSTAQRYREIGTRVALGARPRQILRLILGQGAGLALLGIGLGGVAAVALGRFLSAWLYGVSAFDPATFLAVALLLFAVSLLACFRPARRAVRIDPIEALREE